MLRYFMSIKFNKLNTTRNIKNWADSGKYERISNNLRW